MLEVLVPIVNLFNYIDAASSCPVRISWNTLLNAFSTPDILCTDNFPSVKFHYQKMQNVSCGTSIEVLFHVILNIHISCFLTFSQSQVQALWPTVYLIPASCFRKYPRIKFFKNYPLPAITFIVLFGPCNAIHLNLNSDRFLKITF